MRTRAKPKNFKVTALSFKDYELASGDNIRIKFARNSGILNNIWLPAKVIKEYERFVMVEILPHNNPHGYDKSKPYRLTINKMNIELRDVLIKKIKKDGIIINKLKKAV